MNVPHANRIERSHVKARAWSASWTLNYEKFSYYFYYASTNWLPDAMAEEEQQTDDLPSVFLFHAATRPPFVSVCVDVKAWLMKQITSRRPRLDGDRERLCSVQSLSSGKGGGSKRTTVEKNSRQRKKGHRRRWRKRRAKRELWCRAEIRFPPSVRVSSNSRPFNSFRSKISNLANLTLKRNMSRHRSFSGRMRENPHSKSRPSGWQWWCWLTVCHFVCSLIWTCWRIRSLLWRQEVRWRSCLPFSCMRLCWIIQWKKERKKKKKHGVSVWEKYSTNVWLYFSVSMYILHTELQFIQYKYIGILSWPL